MSFRGDFCPTPLLACHYCCVFVSPPNAGSAFGKCPPPAIDKPSPRPFSYPHGTQSRTFMLSLAGGQAFRSCVGPEIALTWASSKEVNCWEKVLHVRMSGLGRHEQLFSHGYESTGGYGGIRFTRHCRSVNYKGSTGRPMPLLANGEGEG